MEDIQINNIGLLNPNVGKTTQAILKFKSTLKRLGYGLTDIARGTITADSIQSELTLIFMPIFDGTISYSEEYYGRGTWQALREKLMKMKGCSYDFAYYNYLTRGSVDNMKELWYKPSSNFWGLLNGNRYLVGHYLEDRNIVLLYLPTCLDMWVLGKDNEYLNKLLEIIEDLTEKYKIKKINVETLKNKIFYERFTKAIRDQIINSETQIEKSEKSITEYSTYIANSFSSIKTNKQVLEGLKRISDNLKDELMVKVEEIKKLVFVDKVDLDVTGIKIVYKPISIKIKDKEVLMGTYTATLLPNKITIVSDMPIKYVSDIYHSPHIRGNNICFGKEQTTVYKLLGEFDWKKLAHFIYFYLKTYNPDDTYLSLNYWVEDREKRKEVPEVKLPQPPPTTIHEGEEYCDLCSSWVDEDDFDYEHDCCNGCAEDREEDN